MKFVDGLNQTVSKVTQIKFKFTESVSLLHSLFFPLLFSFVSSSVPILFLSFLKHAERKRTEREIERVKERDRVRERDTQRQRSVGRRRWNGEGRPDEPGGPMRPDPPWVVGQNQIPVI
jgi:hypothetical protein